MSNNNYIKKHCIATESQKCNVHIMLNMFALACPQELCALRLMNTKQAKRPS